MFACIICYLHDNPLTGTQMLLVMFWMVLWMVYDWYNLLKPIKWQDGWYEMFDIVDFAMQYYFIHYLVLVQFMKKYDAKN